METGNCISMISKLNIECFSKIGRFLNSTNWSAPPSNRIHFELVYS